MAASVTQIADRTQLGRFTAVLAEITWDTTYPAGGEAISSVLKTGLGLSEVLAVFFSGAAGAAAGTAAQVPKWDRVNDKVQLFESGTAAGGLDEQNTADQSTTKAVVLVIGY